MHCVSHEHAGTVVHTSFVPWAGVWHGNHVCCNAWHAFDGRLGFDGITWDSVQHLETDTLDIEHVKDVKRLRTWIPIFKPRACVQFAMGANPRPFAADGH